MRRVALVLLAFAFTPTLKGNPSEADSIKNLINRAYVEGVHNGGNLEEVAKGFHPEFEMLILREGALSKYSINTWIDDMKRRRETNPLFKPERTDANYLNIDITGNSATVKLELIKGGKVIFTDYLFLYKFGEDWKIVSKIFYRH